MHSITTFIHHHLSSTNPFLLLMYYTYPYILTLSSLLCYPYPECKSIRQRSQDSHSVRRSGSTLVYMSHRYMSTGYHCRLGKDTPHRGFMQ